jgi:hypothetical protein
MGGKPRFSTRKISSWTPLKRNAADAISTKSPKERRKRRWPGKAAEVLRVPGAPSRAQGAGEIIFAFLSNTVV